MPNLSNSIAHCILWLDKSPNIHYSCKLNHKYSFRLVDFIFEMMDR